jgi:predicted aspartyl protease
MKALRWVQAFAVCLGFAFSVACGGGSSSSSTTTPPQTIVPSGNNVASISVNGGPLGNYVDAAFVSVTVCIPGSSNCQTIDNVLVDTGSSGLRVLSSVLTLPLPQQTSGGNPVVECFPFVSGNTWGPVQTADVEIAGEKASSLPIQVIGETTFNPQGVCTAPQEDVESLGANGIVGVGLFVQDCSAPSCLASYDVYYVCPSASTCTAITEAAAQEVQNPVSFFATDNNGVILELPAVSGSETSVSGSLVFGIGTESNNALNGATIYTADDYGNFTTSYNGTAYPDSFIDSGSNGYYFLDQSLTGITECGGDESGFYCPASTVNISATNQGENGSSGAISFSIADANTLFQSNDSAYSDLGGISGTSAPYYFDLGLPFFFGRNLYTGLQSATYPNGYWAY